MGLARVCHAVYMWQGTPCQWHFFADSNLFSNDIRSACHEQIQDEIDFETVEPSRIFNINFTPFGLLLCGVFREGMGRGRGGGRKQREQKNYMYYADFPSRMWRLQGTWKAWICNGICFSLFSRPVVVRFFFSKQTLKFEWGIPPQFSFHGDVSSICSCLGVVIPHTINGVLNGPKENIYSFNVLMGLVL